MSALPEDQLLELLVQLQKTTPEAARAILASQPQIAYASMALLIKLNVLDLQAFQSTLTAYTMSQAQAAAPPPAPAPQPSVPANLLPTSGYPQATPGRYPSQAQMYPPQPMAQNGAEFQLPGFGMAAPAPPQPVGGNPYYGMPPPQPAAPAVPQGSALLASVPDEQKEMIMRIISMTPEQVNLLPPTERTNIQQIRLKLGLPT